jgi:hypothetical protein
MPLICVVIFGWIYLFCIVSFSGDQSCRFYRPEALLPGFCFFLGFSLLKSRPTNLVRLKSRLFI